MKFDLKHCFGVVLCGTGLLLTACNTFRAREIDLEKRSRRESKSYYRFTAGGGENLSFQSQNFLSSNLLMSDFRDDGEKLVRRLAIRQELEPSRTLLSMLSDVCFQLAQNASDKDEALRYDLAAVYYASELLFDEKYRDRNLGNFDPSIYQTARIYNGALARIYAELVRRDLLRKGQYRLQTANGRDVIFDLPHYDLIYPASAYQQFMLCSDYRIRNLSHFTYEFGLGVPIIAQTNRQTRYKALLTAAPIAHGATAFLRFTPAEKGDPKRVMHARLEFYDNDRIRSVQVNGQKIPLIFDYSTPFAYYISTMPDMNVVDYMLNPYRFQSGLYTLEPYQPNKIPVVLVHGLLSSIHTWMQMVNALKNDPEIRKHCQFWFFTYSTGNPILYSASMLRSSLHRVHDELATTPEAREAFSHMVIIGHSMGGLLTKTLLQDPGDILVRKVTGKPWTEVEKLCTPEQKKMFEDIVLYKSVPFVRRVLFLAVPHHGANMAKYSQVRTLARLIELPADLVKEATGAMKTLSLKKDGVPVFETRIKNGLEELSPKVPTLWAIDAIPLRPDVPRHSIIGNNRKDTPGGSDGVVEYSSSHRDDVRSELVVRSGHSVQTHPVAIYEVRRILLEHLKEEKICDSKQLSPAPHANAEKPASRKDAPAAARQ
ncbi:MAG: hypothetical protein IKO93_12690 [Lentisphaeria bacterium]|nr:hypothetical protein [Lentisphaeria bacterium]